MPRYITPEGFQALVDEYERLLKVERPIMTAEVRYAASLGDRSENAEYHYGKKKLRAIDKRLRFLKKRMEAAEVVDPVTVACDHVRFGATVVVEDDDGVQSTYRIVGEDESKAELGHISYTSPIGRALIGKSEDDEAQIRAPGGVRSVVVVEIRYQ